METRYVILSIKIVDAYFLLLATYPVKILYKKEVGSLEIQDEACCVEIQEEEVV